MKVLNILILDDEQMLLDLLTMMLHPHTSTVCSSLSEAQSLIASDPEAFDVMLCDIMMPRGGGLISMNGCFVRILPLSIGCCS